MVVVAATPTSGAVSDLNEDEVGTRGPSDTTPSLPVHGRSFNKLDDAYEHCGSGQLLPYTRTSLAWTIAAPLTLLSVYLTYSGGSQLHGSAAAEQRCGDRLTRVQDSFPGPSAQGAGCWHGRAERLRQPDEQFLDHQL